MASGAEDQDGAGSPADARERAGLHRPDGRGAGDGMDVADDGDPARTADPVRRRGAGGVGGRPPVARWLVAAGLAVETLLMAIVAVSVAMTSVTGSAQDRAGAAVLAVTALALAAGLGAVTAGVLRGARWARSPALVWQIIQVAVGALNLPVAIGTPLVVLGVAVGYGVLRRDVLPRAGDVTPPR